MRLEGRGGLEVMRMKLEGPHTLEARREGGLGRGGRSEG